MAYLIASLAAWVVGAVAVIAIWGDPSYTFPPWVTGNKFDDAMIPPTGAVAFTWPLVLACYAIWWPLKLVGRAGMRLNARLIARREAKRIPRAEVRK